LSAGGVPVVSPNVQPASVHAATAAAPMPPMSKSTSPSPSVDSTASSWATVGKSAPGQKQINIAPKKPANRKYILLNKYDERIDPDLPKPDASAQARLFERTKKQKVCNNYHLRGHCEAGKYCDYDHGERLSPGEQLALKHRARTRSCPEKSACRDFDCTNGHICPYGTNCYNDGCWFQDLHDVDLVSGICIRFDKLLTCIKEPSVRFYENGDVERLRNLS